MAKAKRATWQVCRVCNDQMYSGGQRCEEHNPTPEHRAELERIALGETENGEIVRLRALRGEGDSGA